MLLLTLYLGLAIFLKVKATTEQPPYEVLELPIQPGIYMEMVAPTRLYHETWTIVNYVNIRELDERSLTILHCLTELKLHCNYGKIICKADNAIDNLNNIIIRTNDNKIKLEHMLGRKTRKQRGTFNFIGDIAKILFGTMSNSDAEYYNREIDRILGDNYSLTNMIKNQTEIISATFNSIARSFDNFENRFSRINKNIEFLQQALKDIKVTERLMEWNSNIDLALLDLSNVVYEYRDDIDILINAVMNAKKGLVHPQVISPALFMESIKKIKEKRDHSELPISAEEHNFSDLMDISEVNIAFISHKLIYVIKVPLLERNIMQTFKLTPILKQTDKRTFIYLDPPFEYIITNIERTVFSPTDVHDLDKCRNLQRLKICERRNPDYSIQAHDTCVSLILTEPSKLSISPKDCALRALKINSPIWNQLRFTNAWIFTTPTTEILHIHCDDNKLRTI